MWGWLSLFITYLVIETLLLGMGVVVGFLLHWLWPAVDLGIAILIGVVATGFSAHFYGRLMSSMEEKQLIDELDQEIISRAPTYVMPLPPKGKRRRR
jgi:NhaP-type Na+/H+ or K+/H+ antiporter